METLSNSAGFLGTNASLLQDINLIVQIFFYLVLCFGIVAQRKEKFHLHDWTQSPVVVLNLIFIGLVMIPSARTVAAEIPARLSETYFLIPTVHIILGTLSEGLAIYGLLSGFKVLPRKIGVLRYWMWATFVLWTAAVIFGIGIYFVWYGGDAQPEITVVSESVAAPVAEQDEDTVAGETPTEAGPTAAASDPTAESATSTVTAEAPTTAPTPDEPVSEHSAAQVEAATPTGTPVPPTPEQPPADGPPPETTTPEAAMPSAGAEPAWLSLETSNIGPGARYEHAMQYNAGTNQVFIFGGRDGSQDYNDVWVLDLNTLAWREVAANSPAKPGPRHSTVMIVDSAAQNLYVATGQGPGGNLNDIWKLDLATETWQDLTAGAGPGPEARYGDPGGNLNDNLVLTHGFGTTRYDTTWLFNTQTGQWENITPAGELPLKRCLFAATTRASSGNLVIHGGCASGFGDCFLDDTWVFDTAGQAWRQIQSETKPAGRQHQTITEAGDGWPIILFGGQGADRAARDDVWALHLSANSWSPLDLHSGPPARYNHSAAWIPGSGVLVFGGRDNNNAPLGDLWLLSLDPSTLQPGAGPAPAEPEPTATPVPAEPEPTPTPILISPPEGPEHEAGGG